MRFSARGDSNILTTFPDHRWSGGASASKRADVKQSNELHSLAYGTHLRPKERQLTLIDKQVWRIGLPILPELQKSGYRVTVLTRDAKHLKDLSAGIKIQQVDYG
jgi:hypothetical protein